MFASLENLGQISPIGMILPGFAPFIGGTPSSAQIASPTYGCPNGIFQNTPTAPTYDARYSLQKDAPHSSGINPGEACPPEMEGGQVRRGQEYSFFYAKSGNVYITTTRGWSPCPKWPTPLPVSGTLPELIYKARVWVDQASPVMAWAVDVFGSDSFKIRVCPGYPPESKMDGGFYSPIASQFDIPYAPFLNYIWKLVFPEGGANTLISGWMNFRGTYQVPIRPDPYIIPPRAGYLSQLSKTWDAPPWPHPWFRSFITSPLVTVPPFYSGYFVNDPKICESNYFPRDTETIKHDLAVYLSTNEKLLNDHFNAEAQRWLDAEEAKMKKAMELQKALGWVATVLDIFTFGAASAVLALTRIATTRSLLNQQKNNIKLMASNFGVTDKQIEDFSLWIVHYYGAPPVKVPVTGVNEAPSGRYAVYIESKPIKYANTTDDALKIAFSNSATGERILVKDTTTGEAVGYFIREASALRKAPASIAGALQAMSPETAKSMVTGGSGFPVWLAALPIAMKVMKVI